VPSTEETHPRGLLVIGRQASLFALGPVLLASALAASATWLWVGELVASLSWHLGLASFAVVALCLVARRFGLASIALALGLVHAGPELVLWLPQEEGKAANEVELKLATCNLLWGNEEFDGFHRWLEAHEPDVVILQEISMDRRDTLLALEQYPYLYLSPEPDSWTPDTWGTGILSRLPFESVRDVPTAFGRPPVEAVVRLGGPAGPRLTLRGTHTNRPGRPWRNEQRNEVLDTLAHASWVPASVLAGDLNTTSTSPAFRRLLDTSGLSDSRRGFGRQPTFELKGLVRLAIDHVLVGGDVRVLARETSELPGSDHRAVLVRLAIPAGSR